jgi:20S proteasome alpha/beta subunit
MKGSSASFLLLQCLLLLLASSSSASSSTTAANTPSRYESIRALDENGQSKQLQHANQAAMQHGTLILAIKHANETIHIISVTTTSPHRRQRPLALIHKITPNTFVLCSGVQADARWLIDKLRELHQQMQLRYGSSGEGWAQRLSSLYRAVFWGIPEETDKWQHTRWLDLERWGRPLGVQSIIIEQKQLCSLEPSGVIKLPDPHQQLAAIGKHSTDILFQWRSSSNSDSLVEQVRVACEGILPRGTILSISQIGTDISWQMGL